MSNRTQRAIEVLDSTRFDTPRDEWPDYHEGVAIAANADPADWDAIRDGVPA